MPLECLLWLFIPSRARPFSFLVYVVWLPAAGADFLMCPDVLLRHFWGTLLSGFSGSQLSASRVWGQPSPHPGICECPVSRSLHRWCPAGSCRFLQTGSGAFFTSAELRFYFRHLGHLCREPAFSLGCSPMLGVEAWSPSWI